MRASWRPVHQGHSTSAASSLEPTVPGACHGPVVLPKGLIQLHTTPLAFSKVRLPDISYHASLRPTDLLAHGERQVQRMQGTQVEPGRGQMRKRRYPRTAGRNTRSRENHMAATGKGTGLERETQI